MVSLPPTVDCRADGASKARVTDAYRGQRGPWAFAPAARLRYNPTASSAPAWRRATAASSKPAIASSYMR